MKKIKVIIEKNDDGYWGHSTNIANVVGYGETLDACKINILESIELAKELEGNNKFPYADGEYELVYNFDLVSLLENYKGILSNVAFEKITGINQKQMHHYATGLKKPRAEQRKKIEQGLHKLGQELLAIEL